MRKIEIPFCFIIAVESSGWIILMSQGAYWYSFAFACLLTWFVSFQLKTPIPTTRTLTLIPDTNQRAKSMTRTTNR